MWKRVFKVCGVIFCASMIVPAQGEVINWKSTEEGFYDQEFRWDPERRPGPNDDAKHLSKASAISIRQDASCKTFEGNGAAGNDRFLVVEASEVWTIGSSPSNNGELEGVSGNFKVKLQVHGVLHAVVWGR